jgi:hypothetical protein
LNRQHLVSETSASASWATWAYGLRNTNVLRGEGFEPPQCAKHNWVTASSGSPAPADSQVWGEWGNCKRSATRSSESPSSSASQTAALPLSYTHRGGRYGIRTHAPVQAGGYALARRHNAALSPFQDAGRSRRLPSKLRPKCLLSSLYFIVYTVLSADCLILVAQVVQAVRYYVLYL